MVSLLLAIIYLEFLSLGLPDSLLGSAWPVIRETLDVPLAGAGIISMIICGGTIISSLFAGKLIHKLGTGLTASVSVGLTALALCGFSFSHHFISLCLFAIPYGLGAGAVDAAMNNYIALHYSSRTISWLHATWGVGVTISPNIMAFALTKNGDWNLGYRIVAIIMGALTVLFFIALPLWKKNQKPTDISEKENRVLPFREIIKIKGVPLILLAFFGFCALESTAGLWASSYLVEYRGVDVNTAARFAMLFYSGEMAGRFLNGVVADKFGDKVMIRVGIIGMGLGALMVVLPLQTNIVAFIGLVVVGLGAAPVYPCIIHQTPYRFGKEKSQSLVGLQMASAYTGSTFMPPLFGLIAQSVSIGLYPIYLGIFVVIMITTTELLNAYEKKKSPLENSEATPLEIK